MSFVAATPLTVASPAVWFRRYFQGIFVSLTVGGVTVRLTQNHPVLTWSGWVPARGVHRGVWVVACGLDEAAVPVGDLWVDEIEQAIPWTLDVSRREFFGDGDHWPATIIGEPARPYVGEEGTQPRVDAWPTLAALASPAEFGCSTWPQACTKVPGLERTWPDGQPDARGAGIDLETRWRLGDAVEALPHPPVDRTVLAKALTGLAGQLRMAPVQWSVETLGGGHVHDTIGTHHCGVAGEILVG